MSEFKTTYDKLFKRVQHMVDRVDANLENLPPREIISTKILRFESVITACKGVIEKKPYPWLERNPSEDLTRFKELKEVAESKLKEFKKKLDEDLIK